jgi:dihydroflavonol-4-reductase
VSWIRVNQPYRFVFANRASETRDTTSYDRGMEADSGSPSARYVPTHSGVNEQISTVESTSVDFRRRSSSSSVGRAPIAVRRRTNDRRSVVCTASVSQDVFATASVMDEYLSRRMWAMGDRMRVLVTGGTGFVGCHSVAALVRAGHSVRLVVRSRDRIAPALGPVGIDPAEVESLEGDATDAQSVQRAVEDCDALLNCAAVYSLDARDSATMVKLGARGAEIALEAAWRGGLDPIVHVSSYVALLPSDGKPLTEDTPVKDPPVAYPRSKAEAERVARGYQERGAPVVIVYPGSVWGPHDPYFGESDQIARNILSGAAPLVPRGRLAVVDVRDVAAAHATVMVAGRGPRRYLLGGYDVDYAALHRMLGDVTARRLQSIPVPAGAAWASARLADRLQRLVPFRLPVSAPALWIMRHHSSCDNERARAELGFEPRPLAETLTDTVASLLARGRISARQAGHVAAAG